MKGKAAVFIEAGKFEIREYPVVEIENEGILIKVSSAGICGSDLHFWRGDMKPIAAAGKPGPIIIGHELTGIVAGMGKNITTDSKGLPLKEGDRVVFPYFFPCRKCYNCLRNEYNHCPHRFRFRRSVNEFPFLGVGGYAEYYYLWPGHDVFRVPDGIQDDILTPVNCALSQVIYALQRANIQMGDSVVIQGAGGLGLYAVAVAKEMGASLIISVDGIQDRLDVAKEYGADYTINISEVPDSNERIELVKKYTSYRGGADIGIEVVGFPQVVPEGLEMLRNGGTYVEVGNIWPSSFSKIDMSRIVFKMLTVIGTAHYDPYILPVAVDFIDKNQDKYAFTKVSSNRYPLEDINQAFSDAEWHGKEKNPQKVTRAILVP
tara:strand:+ start:730 stop:1857 length:1128 start_codon:yes stop_codon:yes gene_type:complete